MDFFTRMVPKAVLYSLVVLVFALTPFPSAIASAEAIESDPNDKSYYLVEKKVAKLFNFMPQVNPSFQEASSQYDLVQLSLDEVEKLADKIHGTFHTCGGFVQVDDPVEEAGGVAEFIAGGLGEAIPFVSAPFEVSGVRYAPIAQQLMAMLKEERFVNSLQQFTAFPDRSARTENGRKAAEWLRDEALRYAQSLGRNDVTVQMVPTGSRYTQDSVLVRIPGETNQPGVLVGGHMDTYRGNMPGADDDASGTISALEIFRTFLDSGFKFQRDIYIAFYAAEEMGLVGSSRVARLFRDEGRGLRAALQFDMTGYRSSRETKDMYFINDNVSQELTAFGEQVARDILGIPADKIGRTNCGYACSDHASWTRQGYASVFPFEGSFDNRNRSIHSSRDTMATLSIPHAMRFVEFGMAFMTELAEPILN